LIALEDDEDEVGNNKEETGGDKDDDDLDPSVVESDTAIIEQVTAEVEDHIDTPTLTRADINLGRFAVTKVRHYFGYMLLYHSNIVPSWQLLNLAKWIFNSLTIHADLEIACVWTKTKPLLMVRDVATCWNSTAELIEQALLLHEALNLLVNFEQHNKPRSARLKWFQLTKQEWELLEKLFPMLEVIILCSNVVIYAVLTLSVLRFFSSLRNKCRKARHLFCTM
jgi:hypothetical protein